MNDFSSLSRTWAAAEIVVAAMLTWRRARTAGRAAGARAWRKFWLFPLLGAVVAPGTAQTTFVSNLNQVTNGFDVRSVGRHGSETYTVGMRFTTGSEAVTVNTFTLAFGALGTATMPSGFELKLYSSFAAGVGPSGLVGTFTGSDPASSGDFDFTGSAALSANTSYFLIATAPTTDASGDGSYFSWRHTDNTAEDAGSISGWSIGDTFIAQNPTFPTWTESLGGAVVFSVEGTSAVPEPSTWAALAGAAALGLAGWRRRRSRQSVASWQPAVR